MSGEALDVQMAPDGTRGEGDGRETVSSSNLPAADGDAAAEHSSATHSTRTASRHGARRHSAFAATSIFEEDAKRGAAVARGARAVAGRRRSTATG